MIWCKCIQKIRDNNGIIIEYEIADLNGEHRIVSKDALKNAIAARQVSIVNLKLSKDGKLMDRSIEEQAKLTKELHLGIVTEDDKNKYLKARMLGIAPVVKDNGWVDSFPNAEQIAITPNIYGIESNGQLSNKTIIFYGNNKLRFSSYGETYGKAIIKNPTLVAAMVNQEFKAKEIVLDFDDMDLKLIDIIFKHFKSDYEYNNDEYSKVFVENSRLDCEDVYNRVHSILKRQKPSSKPDRRCYDIIAYLRLIHCMYKSFGNNSILSLANEYITEYKFKVNRISYSMSRHGVYVLDNEKATNKLIEDIRRN